MAVGRAAVSSIRSTQPINHLFKFAKRESLMRAIGAGKKRWDGR
jgi:hypothetical protein